MKKLIALLVLAMNISLTFGQTKGGISSRWTNPPDTIIVTSELQLYRLLDNEWLSNVVIIKKYPKVITLDDMLEYQEWCYNDSVDVAGDNVTIFNIEAGLRLYRNYDIKFEREGKFVVIKDSYSHRTPTINGFIEWYKDDK